MNFLKKSICLLIVLLPLTALTACSSSGEKKSDQPQVTEQAPVAQTQTVRLFGFKFAPNTITIKVGDSITFENADPDIRNVTISALNVDQNIEPNQAWSYTFNTAGEYSAFDRLTEGNPTLTIIVQ